MSELNIFFVNALFESVPNDIQVLETIKDAKGVITDFKYLLTNKIDGEMGTRNLLLSEHPLAKKGGLFERLVKVAETGEPLDEVLNYKNSQQDIWYRLKAQKFNETVIVSREDLTPARQAEERLMQLNRALFAKNRELEALSSELKTFNTIAANDYNDTLRNLYTSMEFIISNDARSLSDSGKANVRRAQAAIQKLKLLTEDIVAFSRITNEEPLSPVQLEKIISIVVENMERKISEHNAKIVYNELPVIHGYPLLLTILFGHLIDNAIKFRKPDEDPKITIAHSKKCGSVIEHSAANKEQHYDVLSIVDNGIGFDMKEGEKIFTMFYRLHEKGKAKGSGIGLAICKKIMDLHDGFISSECTPECTTFHCFFPVQS